MKAVINLLILHGRLWDRNRMDIQSEKNSVIHPQRFS